MPGAFFQWNDQTSQLTPYMNMTDDIYMDGTGNREKVITYLEVAHLGELEVTTFVDAAAHKMYTKVPALGQCTIQDLPQDFNLTVLENLASDPSANITHYLGERNLPWATSELFYTFRIEFGDVKETVYFCKKTGSLKWVTMDGKPFIIKTSGQDAAVFTDKDFEGLTCDKSNTDGLALFNFFHPVHRRLAMN